MICLTKYKLLYIYIHESKTKVEIIRDNEINCF